MISRIRLNDSSDDPVAYKTIKSVKFNNFTNFYRRIILFVSSTNNTVQSRVKIMNITQENSEIKQDLASPGHDFW